MTTAADILEQAQDILNDAGVRWLEAELLRWVNLGQQTIVTMRPDANALGQNLTLVAGTLQTLPAGGQLLIDIARNMGADGLTPGRPVRLVQRELLDMNPSWHGETPANYIANYAYDERIPGEYWVYPPAQAGIKVFATVSMTPTTVAATGDDLDIGIRFDGALLDYLLFRAFSKDAAVGSQQRAVTHFKSFALALGAEAMAKLMASPNAFNLDGVPPRGLSGGNA